MRDAQKLFIEDGYSEMFWIDKYSTQVFIYHVPKLEYTGEDIQIVATMRNRKGKYRPVLAG